MKKLFIFLLALVASVGTIFASDTQVDGIWYNFDNSTQTASVTYRGADSYSYSDEYSGTVTIPASVTYNGTNYSVTSIGDGAFYSCTGLTSVTIGNSVTSIGYVAFSGCTGLTSITIPNSVTSIGDWAFYNLLNIVYNGTAEGAPWGARCINGCIEGIFLYSDASKTNLVACVGTANSEIIIPNSVTSIGGFAFANCTVLTSITIPNSVTSIGDGAFSGCSSLTSITIPNSVTSIGEYAFSGCSSITSIIIPNSVTSIGNNAFYGCSNVQILDISNNDAILPGIGTIANFYNLKKVTAPAAFYGGPYPAGTALPENLEEVVVSNGELTEAFLLSALKNYYKKTLKKLDMSATTYLELPDEAFKGLYNLQSLSLPENLRRVSYLAVADCKNLQSITIPASVEEIEQSAFEDCRSLTYISFAENAVLTKIGNWAFYNCHQLSQITIPDGVTEIGDAAFYGCVYVQSLQIPASVQSMGDNAFALCSRITRMDVDAVLPPAVEEKTFFEVSTTAPVYVPDESVNIYKAHPIWGKLNIVGKSQIPQGIENTSAIYGESHMM